MKGMKVSIIIIIIIIIIITVLLLLFLLISCINVFFLRYILQAQIAASWKKFIANPSCVPMLSTLIYAAVVTNGSYTLTITALCAQ